MTNEELELYRRELERLNEKAREGIPPRHAEVRVGQTALPHAVLPRPCGNGAAVRQTVLSVR